MTTRMRKAGILKVAAGLALGALVGIGGTYFVLITRMRQGFDTMQAANVTTSVETLQALRETNTQGAIKLQESFLNGAVLSFYGSSPSEEGTRKALELAREYREKHPFAGPYSNVNNTVSEILSNAK